MISMLNDWKLYLKTYFSLALYLFYLSIYLSIHLSISIYPYLFLSLSLSLFIYLSRSNNSLKTSSPQYPLIGIIEYSHWFGKTNQKVFIDLLRQKRCNRLQLLVIRLIFWRLYERLYCFWSLLWLLSFSDRQKGFDTSSPTCKLKRYGRKPAQGRTNRGVSHLKSCVCGAFSIQSI